VSDDPLTFAAAGFTKPRSIPELHVVIPLEGHLRFETRCTCTHHADRFCDDAFRLADWIRAHPELAAAVEALGTFEADS
jgi:hypothetical protein